MRNKQMRWTLMVFLAFISGAAQAATPVPPIHVSGLNEYRGKTLAVFYVSGRAAAIGTSGQVLNVRSVKAGPVEAEIPASGRVIVPAQEVPTLGFDVFNYLLFVVYGPRAEGIFIQNPDGTFPSDPRVTDASAYSSIPPISFQYDRTGFVSRKDFRDFTRVAGDQEILAFDFKKDLK